MKFVFHEVGMCERTIRTVLSDYLQAQEKDSIFYSTFNQTDGDRFQGDKDEEYMIFYRIDAPYGSEKIRGFIKENGIRARIVALCTDDRGGIKAADEGSDYALLLPLKSETIIHCYEHFQCIRQ